VSVPLRGYTVLTSGDDTTSVQSISHALLERLVAVVEQEMAVSTSGSFFALLDSSFCFCSAFNVFTFHFHLYYFLCGTIEAAMKKRTTTELSLSRRR
jgi:hypothetical protein